MKHKKKVFKIVVMLEIIFVLILITLIAVYQGNKAKSSTENSKVTMKQENNNDLNNVEEEDDDAKIETAAYQIELVQETLTGKGGETIAVISYEKPVLEGEVQAIQKINQSIDRDCSLNFELYKDNLFQYAQGDYDAGVDNFDDAYYYTCECEVTNNKQGVISFKISTNWYAGGVGNQNCYGLTYSLEDGEALGLDGVIEGTSAEIKDRIVTASQEYINNNSSIGWNSDALEVIKKYEVSEYKYYLEEDKVNICFDVYELASGNDGPQVIRIKR